MNLSRFHVRFATVDRAMRLLPALLLLATFLVSAETVYQGKVVKIADGADLPLTRIAMR